MTRPVLFALALFCALPAQAAASPFEAACIAHFGPERAALCTCLEEEAARNATATRQPQRTMDAMAQLFAHGGTHPVVEGNRRQDKRAAETLNTWRITLQNSALFCTDAGKGLPDPFFGLRY